MLQGLLLQVLHQGVTVVRPRRALLRLVTLPETSWQHGVLGGREVKGYVDVALRLESREKGLNGSRVSEQSDIQIISSVPKRWTTLWQ